MKKKLIAIALITTSILTITSCNRIPDNIVSTEGSFDATFEDNGEIFYQFKSDDDSAWWILSEQDVGHKPNMSDKYILTYDNKGTVSCTHDDCECYVYDDEFVKIEKIS